VQYLLHKPRYRAVEFVYLRRHCSVRAAGIAVLSIQVREEDSFSLPACHGGTQPYPSSLPGLPDHLGRRARRPSKAYNGGPLPVRDQSAFRGGRRGRQVPYREPECRPGPLGWPPGDAELFGEYIVLRHRFTWSYGI
jgi:hypothetical protein